MSWIQTRSGKPFTLLDPDPDSIEIEDIAHALSQLCRFTGHTSSFMSVAQHSVIVASLLDDAERFNGLMHDAPEAYLGDVSRPLRELLPEYLLIENGVWAVMAAKYGLSPTLSAAVKEADNISLMWERRDLLGQPVASWARWVDEETIAKVPSTRLDTWSPQQARHAFLDTFHELS